MDSFLWEIPYFFWVWLLCVDFLSRNKDIATLLSSVWLSNLKSNYLVQFEHVCIFLFWRPHVWLFDGGDCRHALDYEKSLRRILMRTKKEQLTLLQLQHHHCTKSTVIIIDMIEFSLFYDCRLESWSKTYPTLYSYNMYTYNIHT